MHAKSSSSSSIMVEQLVKGKETAARLQNLLLITPPDRHDDRRRVSAQDLALQIFTSFARTLSVLTTSVAGKSSTSKATLGITRDRRRGCYKRRCYFRCTNKYDRGCKATKQVQLIQENPITLYQTTYFNRHTCSSSTRTGDDHDHHHAPITTWAPPHAAVSGSDPVEPTNLLLSFQESTHHHQSKQDHDQHPANPISEVERSVLQDQWLDVTEPEYYPVEAPLTGSVQEEGSHYSIDRVDIANEFGDIHNFHLDQIF